MLNHTALYSAKRFDLALLNKPDGHSVRSVVANTIRSVCPSHTPATLLTVPSCPKCALELVANRLTPSQIKSGSHLTVFFVMTAAPAADVLSS